MEPIGFTECSFDINGRDFTQKFIVCNNQTRPIILGKDFAARNCIGVVWTKQGLRKMIDDDCKVIMEVKEQTTDIPLSLTNSIRIQPHTIAVAVVECAKHPSTPQWTSGLMKGFLGISLIYTSHDRM